MNKKELKQLIKLNSHLDYDKGEWRPASVYVPLVIDLIDKLDEPKDCTEALLDLGQTLVRVQAERDKAEKELFELKDMQPEKPVVPKFVAEWYEKNKFNGWWNWLYKWGKEPIEDELEKRVRDWFVDYHEYEFVDMHRIGYTVEKEKKYKVKLFDGHLLGRYQDGELAFVKGLTGATTSFTETEIKDIDSKLWPFAEEVKHDE